MKARTMKSVEAIVSLGSLSLLGAERMSRDTVASRVSVSVGTGWRRAKR